MRSFEIRTRSAIPVKIGTLSFDETRQTWSIDLDIDAAISGNHGLLTEAAENGTAHLDHELAVLWVRSRIAPPSRQNINDILANAGLDHYDEVDFIAATRGETHRDDLCIREVRGI